MSEFVKLFLTLLGMARFDTAEEKRLLWSYFSFSSGSDSWLPVSTQDAQDKAQASTPAAPNGSKKGGMKVVLAVLGLATLYAINNNLTFYIYTMSDPATFSLFKSMTSFTTALVMYFFLSRPIHRGQWFAVVFQCAGLVVFQYDPCKGSPLYPALVYGLLTIAVAITTVSSVWNDHVLKSANLSLNGVNVFLYAFGICLNFLFFIRERMMGGPAFFEGYSWQACLVVFFNSIIGIAITLVYKFGDALVKTFASSITAVLLLAVSVMFFGLESNIVTWTGALVTVVATYMYLTDKGPTQPSDKQAHQQKVEPPTNASKHVNAEHTNTNNWQMRYMLAVLVGITVGMTIVYLQMLSVSAYIPSDAPNNEGGN